MHICSTLSGCMAVLHPTLKVLVREDGAVFVKHGGRSRKYKWTYGSGKPYKNTSISGKTYQVHRLVCEAFKDNPHKYRTVDHINGDKTDNRAINLRFASFKMQADNTKITRLPPKYGIRPCENPTEYLKRYREENHERLLTYYKEYKQRRKKT